MNISSPSSATQESHPGGAVDADLALVAKALEVLPRKARRACMGAVWIKLREMQTPEGMLKVLRNYARHLGSQGPRVDVAARDVVNLDEATRERLMRGLVGKDLDMIMLLSKGMAVSDVAKFLRVSRVTVSRKVAAIAKARGVRLNQDRSVSSVSAVVPMAGTTAADSVKDTNTSMPPSPPIGGRLEQRGSQHAALRA